MVPRMLSIMGTTPCPSQSVPQRAASPGGSRLTYTRDQTLPELFCFQLGRCGRPSLLNFPSVTLAFLNLLQLSALFPGIPKPKEAPATPDPGSPSLSSRGSPPGRCPGGRLTEQRAYEDDDLHGGGELAVQLRLAKLPERAAVAASRLGAGHVARLAGISGNPATVMPHGEAGAPAQSSPAREVASDPSATCSSPVRGETRGCLVESWRTPGSRGSPQVSTSPAPAPGRRGAERARLRPMPAPSRVPVSSHMKAARSEPAERRPSLLGGQLGQAHLAERETQEVSDSQGGRSLLPPPSSTSAPTTEGQDSPLESPQTDRLRPSPQREENIWLKPFFSPAGFEARWPWETRKMAKSNAWRPEGTLKPLTALMVRVESSEPPQQLRPQRPARLSLRMPARSPAQPLAECSDLPPRRGLQGSCSAAPLLLRGPVPRFLDPLRLSAAARAPPDFAGTREDIPSRSEEPPSAMAPDSCRAPGAMGSARPASADT